MPPGKKGRNAPVASGGDGIDALPDGVLEHILGFLLVEEAVRTCVLARHWCHLWKSATCLRITCDPDDVDKSESLKKLQEFVDHLLRLRGCAPLETFYLRFCGSYNKDDTPPESPGLACGDVPSSDAQA